MTESNQPITRLDPEEIPMMRRYVGQLADRTDEEIEDLPLEEIMGYAQALHDRMEQAYAMKADLVELVYRWAEMNNYSHVYNPDQTWYIGPKSPATKPSQNISKTGWTMLTAVGNKRNFTTIRKAIEDMNTLGRRTSPSKKKYQPKPKPGPLSKFNI